ncbi:MAG: DUF6607 family protein, partial [Pseudomonadota bacterium]
MKRSLPFILAAAMLATGCATTSIPETDSATMSQAEPGMTAPAFQARSAELLEQDREAIRAMVGEYIVTFAFDETVPLIEDYEKKEPKRSGASEVVILIEDRPNKISLQHLLIVGAGQVIKHWRQDWVYQAEWRLD